MSRHPLRSEEAGGTPAVTAVAPTSAATLLIAANARRRLVRFVNNHATVACYVGPTNAVTAATGMPLAAAGGSFEDDQTTGAWYGIVASGTGDVRVLEVS